MALEMNDLMALKSMGGNELTPYEQFKVGHMQSKRASSTSIGALAVGVGAAVLAIGAGAWAGSQAQKAKEVAAAKNDGLRDLVQTLASTVAAERNERIDDEPCYNRCALWVTMNMIMSDSSETLEVYFQRQDV